MGYLSHFALDDLISRYGTRWFVETGTGRGNSLLHAAQYSFTMLFSCEIDEQLYVEAQRLIAPIRGRTVLRHATSLAFLDAVLFTPQDALELVSSIVIPRDQPILFWLDAHFPGADYLGVPYDACPNPDLRMPLVHELRTIRHHRPGNLDVILIDDARLWLDGAFRSGPLPDALRPLVPSRRDIGFIRDMFGATHRIFVDYDEEGYIALLPKQLYNTPPLCERSPEAVA